ncbi:MAG: glycosyltransferase family 2 protein [Planctomycetaceae bacterium]
MSVPPPDVTVVIPNRDQGEFLAAAIDSALADRELRVEVIVVDDGSSDDTPTVLARYGRRIRSLESGGAGACRARNIGLAAAGARFVKFLDADDFLLPGALAAQAAWMDRHGAADTCVCGDARWVDAGGGILPPPPAPAAGLTEAERMVLHAPLTASPLHRVELVRRVGGFDERVPRGQEYDLHLRMWLDGVRFHHRPGEVYAYRQHGAGRISGRDADAAVARGRLDSLERILALAGQRFGTPLPPDLAGALARQFWRIGRRAAQSGVAPVAAELFEVARRLDGRVCEGSAAYRMCCTVFGPIRGESMLRRAKRLLGSGS